MTFMLSRVAVATNEQGKNIGQKLINHGLNDLKSMRTDLVFTYGDAWLECDKVFLPHFL